MTIKEKMCVIQCHVTIVVIMVTRKESADRKKKLDKPGRTRAATVHGNCLKSPDNSDIDMISSVNLLGNYIQIKVGHLNCSALCDSGADINVIHEQLIRNVACKKFISDKKFITAVDTEQIHVYIVVHEI